MVGSVLVALVCAAAGTETSTKNPQTASKPQSKSTKSGSSKSSTSNHHSSTTHHANTSHSKSRKSKKSAKSWKKHGQHGIQSDRTHEIQEALIKQHYLSGEADGVWDVRTQDAMRRFQGDNGWQTKVLPDSRALIKLGLGPDHSGVLNPETAATSPYQPGGGERSGNPNSDTAKSPQQTKPVSQ